MKHCENTAPIDPSAYQYLPYEREGAVDWELLADADAEYRAWVESVRADDLASIERACDPFECLARDAA